MMAPSWWHYGPYIIASYGLAFVTILALALGSLTRLHRAERRLRALDAANQACHGPPQ